MDMILNEGEKIFVVTRRLFEKDLRRHFVGEVMASTQVSVRAQGYSFVFDDSQNEFLRRDDVRTRIISLADAGIVINLLPNEVDLSAVKYAADSQNNRIITDGKSFSMNISEFGLRR